MSPLRPFPLQSFTQMGERHNLPDGYDAGGVLPEHVFRALCAYVASRSSGDDLSHDMSMASATRALHEHLSWSQPLSAVPMDESVDEEPDSDDFLDSFPQPMVVDSDLVPPSSEYDQPPVASFSSITTRNIPPHGQRSSLSQVVSSASSVSRHSVLRRYLGTTPHEGHPLSYCNPSNPYFVGSYFIDFLPSGHIFTCDCNVLPTLHVTPSDFSPCPLCNLCLRTWVRDLTQEGIEPNPGPQRKTKRSSGKKKSRSTRRKQPTFQRRQFSDSLTIRQVADPITLNQSSAGNVYGSFNFTAGASTQISQLTALFDQYMIVKAQIDFRPRVTSFLQGTTPGGMLFTVIDFDDANVPSSTNQLEQYTTVKILPLSKRVTINLRPFFATAGNSQVSGSVLAVPKRGWLDAAYTDINHYGVKYALSQGVAGALQTYDVVITVVLRWRRVR
jgi:hypothetical protein